MSTFQENCRNILLGLLPKAAFVRIWAKLEYVQLPQHTFITHPNELIENYYFPEDGVVSVVATTPEGRKAEIGLVGYEGLVPIAALSGGDRVPYEITVQVAGNGYRISSEDFAELLDSVPDLRTLLGRFSQTFNVQAGFTALSNSVHTIEERLARWILMCHDRVQGDSIALTHEYISIMLAVRRPSVTTTLHILEGNHFIRSQRGIITVTDREALEEFGRDAYGIPEMEYLRLMGRPLKAVPSPVPPDRH